MKRGGPLARQTPLRRRTPLVAVRQPNGSRAIRIMSRSSLNRRRIQAGLAMEPTVAELDALAAQVVKRRDQWMCVRCGRLFIPPGGRAYQWAHVFSKRIHQTRWDAENALGLCTGCHLWGHSHIQAFLEWVREKVLGPERFDALALRFRLAGRGRKIDRVAIMLALRAELADLEVRGL